MGTYKPSRANYDGSTSYGDSATDKHIFSGTVCISGSLILDGTTNISGGSGSVGTDTLNDVTSRGNTTANSITVGSFTSNGDSSVVGNFEATQITGSSISASFFFGDGSGLTGITASVVETDTLDDVTTRGDTTANSITVGGITSTAGGTITGSFLVSGSAITMEVTGGISVSGSTHVDEITFDETHEVDGHTTGRLSWNAVDATLDLQLTGSDVTLQIGQEQHLFSRNDSGVTINNGDAVRISGVIGNKITIEKAISKNVPVDLASEENQIIGVATEEILNNEQGYVTTYGLVRGLNTVGSGSAGDLMFLSNAVSGAFTTTKPPAPYEIVEVGILVQSSPTLGQVFVQPREPTLLTDITSFTSSNIPAGTSYFCHDGTTGITSLSDALTASLLGNVTGDVTGNVTGDLTGTLVEATNITGSIVSASFFYGDGSGITNITAATNTGKALWIDSVNGNDGTATRGKLSSPYLTIGAALSDALSGDTVQVFPGTYPEDGLVVPDGVTIKGVGDWPSIRIGLTSSLSDIMTIGDDSYADHLAFNVPSSSNISALVYSGSAGKTAGAYNITFYGDGLSGLGNGLFKTGPGKMIGAEIRCEAGGVGSITAVDAGVLALESIHVPNSAGDIIAVSSVLSGARGQFVGHNAGNPNVQDAIYISGSSSVAIAFSPNWFNIQNGLHIASEDITAQLLGGQIDASSFTVLVDNGITGSNSEVRLDGIFEPKFSFPPSALNTDFALSFLQAKTDTRPAAQRMFGAELQVGFPEQGTPSFFGEGPQYSDGIVILTTDATATPTTDGANFIDVSTTGTVDDGNTFTFQTQSAGSTILVASQRFDKTGDTLKHFGYDISQVASDLTGTYIFETWNGSEWEEHGVQAVSNENLYRYSNDVFLRSSSLEEVRFGLAENGTPWTKKTINGTEAYWSRIRIDTTGASLPTFNQIKVQPSYFSHNGQGQSSTAGLAMWRDTLVGAGNIFGESGGVVNSSLAVGSGGLPTGWSHQKPNSQLNQNGDAIYIQFAIPPGTCTAFPIKFSLLYSLEGTQPVTSNVTGTLSAIPIQTSGISAADPTGGKLPVLRTFSNTETLTAKAGTAITKDLLPEGATLPETLDNRIHSIDFSPFDISSYYEGDIIAVRFELDDDGTPSQDVSVWALTVEGVNFTEGKEL